MNNQKKQQIRDYMQRYTNGLIELLLSSVEDTQMVHEPTPEQSKIASEHVKQRNKYDKLFSVPLNYPGSVYDKTKPLSAYIEKNGLKRVESETGPEYEAGKYRDAKIERRTDYRYRHFVMSLINREIPSTVYWVNRRTKVYKEAPINQAAFGISRDYYFYKTLRLYTTGVSYFAKALIHIMTDLGYYTESIDSRHIYDNKKYLGQLRDVLLHTPKLVFYLAYAECLVHQAVADDPNLKLIYSVRSGKRSVPNNWVFKHLLHGLLVRGLDDSMKLLHKIIYMEEGSNAIERKLLNKFTQILEQPQYKITESGRLKLRLDTEDLYTPTEESVSELMYAWATKAKKVEKGAHITKKMMMEGLRNLKK